MDWDDFRHLLALSRTGTLSGASGELGVARTTVGRRLQAIEEGLGVRLFDRTPEGFIPTPAGDDLVGVAARMEAEVLAAEARVLGRDVALQGSLNVSTMDFIHAGFFGAFSSFVHRYPGVDLTVSTTTTQVSLRRREADVVLRVSDEPSPHLVGRRLTRLTFQPYAHRSLVERIGAGAPMEAFPWLGDDARSPDAWIEAWLAEHAPGATIIVRATGFQAIQNVLRGGLAAHFYPDILGEQEPELVPIAPHLPSAGRDLWALTLPDLRSNTRVRAFLDHVYDWFSDR